mgnify:CR=1 FL=1|jgi:hypothetical protein
MDESRKMNSNIHNIWSMAKDTDNRVSALHSDVNMVRLSSVLIAMSNYQFYNILLILVFDHAFDLLCFFI